MADGLVPKWWWCKHIYGKHLSCCVKMIWYGRSDIAIQHDSRKSHIHRAPWSWRLLLVCFVWPVYSIFCMINPWWRVRSTGDGYWWWYMKTVSWLKLCCNAFPHGQPWLSLYSVLRRIIFPLSCFPFLATDEWVWHAVRLPRKIDIFNTVVLGIVSPGWLQSRGYSVAAVSLYPWLAKL